MPDRTLLLNTHCLPVIPASFHQCPPPFICSLFKKFSSGGTSSGPSLWFAKTTSDPFWKGGLCGLSAPPALARILSGFLGVPHSCSQPHLHVPGPCDVRRAKWLELSQSSWSSSSPFTSLWLGPPLTLCFPVESHAKLKTEP